MKAKIQIIVGLIIAFVSIVGVLILFIFALIHQTHTINILPLLVGLILPILYGLALIRKKLKQTQIILLLWCVGWIISSILIYSGLANYVPLEIVVFLESIFYAPITVLFIPFFDIFNVSETSVSIRAFGLTIIFLLWIGVRGLKQLNEKKKSEDEQKE